MTVKELIAILRDMDQDAQVYIDRLQYAEEIFEVEAASDSVFILDKQSYLDRL